jgi:hypothetical protein
MFVMPLMPRVAFEILYFSVSGPPLAGHRMVRVASVLGRAGLSLGKCLGWMVTAEMAAIVVHHHLQIGEGLISYLPAR